jgi:hypothetical protein
MKLRTIIHQSLFRSACLGLAATINLAHAATVHHDDSVIIPTVLQELPSAAVRQYQIPERTALPNLPNAKNQGAAPQLLQFDAQHQPVLALPIAESRVYLHHSQRHNNGDITVSGTATIDGQAYQLILTQGRAGVIGELKGATTLLLQQQGNQLFLVDVAAAGLIEPPNENDVPNLIEATRAIQQDSQAQRSSIPPTVQQLNGQAITVVDIMMLYSPDVSAAYPNGLADTLMTQLVAKANQAFVDSGVSMQLRIVHRQAVNYQKPSNFTALNDLNNALDKKYSGTIDSSLAQVRALREQHGADLVSMIRTHDLNERGVCGVAQFPDPEKDFLANISNVGNSGGSICGNTFTHEIGHNFGAGHQFVNGSSVGARPTAGAWIINNKFNTVMSSIGTGDINRNYSLNRFSNPDLKCAGVSCGDKLQADNAATINYFAAINASLFPAVATHLVTPPPVSNPDTDADGTADQSDNFPFDAREQFDSDNDGVGNNTDRFPENAAEQRDYDQDGIGDNSDPDDDNDGVLDTNDALPFDATDSADRDGDGIGDKTDALALNFQEFRDSDNDGSGDRFDQDNDNDGVADFDNRSTPVQQLLVVNAGSGQILALNTTDGRKMDTLYQGPQGGFSFRSDLVSLSPGQLAFVQFSDIIRLDRLRKTSDVLLKRASLSSAFSVGLLKTGDSQTQSRLWLTSGLNPSTFEAFDFANTAMQGSTDKLRSEKVWRDLLSVSGKILLVERDTNQILTIDPSITPRQSAVWASGTGLNKPEQLALLPDGNVLVTNAGSRNVSRFSSQGQYLGEFISAGSGGLANPGCLAVDASGNVYVCSTNTHKILKFSSNGSPIAEFATAESVGINEPVSLLVVAAELDSAPFDGNNDTDGDGVANKLDAFPLDPSRSTAPPPTPPAAEKKSGGTTGPIGLVGLLLLALIRRGSRYFL